MSHRGPRFDAVSAMVVAVAIALLGATLPLHAQSIAGANNSLEVPGADEPTDNGQTESERDSPGDEPTDDGRTETGTGTEFPQEDQSLGTPGEASDDGAGADSGGGTGSWGLQTAMALAVVIGLILLLRVWLRRMSGAPGSPTSRGLVEVLGRTTVGPKTQVLFLRVNERVIVAGQTPAGINTLTCIDEPEEVATLLAQVDADRPQSISQGFGKLLKQFERDGGVDDGEADRSADGAFDRARGELSGLVGRLRHMRSDRSQDEERDVR